ncbi:sodium:solute symporter [Roseivirga sp. BDSF3-8]|uniref:sodium:solute symporter n=1 Tax=Roseivirga sp. BDSF3-8 TaxID=3241598 RepID=UPI00353190F6
MNSGLVIGVIAGYFLFLILISLFTSRGADTKTFFTANRQSPWYLVAFGMIGASLSGVTFISVPGVVGTDSFGYFQVVLGYLVGYLVIGTVLMPLYYRLNLVSIYTYLQTRFGFWSYKTGAFYFILSRLVGASFRLFLVAIVLYEALFKYFASPGNEELTFALTVAITILLIWLYTFRGGIKTIVWTDSLQTLFMLLAVGFSIVIIGQELELSPGELFDTISESRYSKVFFWETEGKGQFFPLQFISGAFIAIVMTGLDQDMMQKNLTCRSLGDAQKNMFWFSVVLVFVNLMFLSLGALLFIYAEAKGIPIPDRTDLLYPTLALNHFTLSAGVLFLLGIIAAAYSSADSALTALTTSFCVDFLGFEEKGEALSEKKRRTTRLLVHITFSFLIFLVVIIFKIVNEDSVIKMVFTAAGYTYGPLLGLYAFGLFTRYIIRDKYVIAVCLISPLLAYETSVYMLKWFGVNLGFFVLVVNGLYTFLGLMLIRQKGARYTPSEHERVGRRAVSTR